ncbi:MAG: DUF1194 domain-containing protein [Pseudomonadota bacterium]
MRFVLALLLILCPLRAASCELALIFAVDVSGSVDHAEFAIQMEGLAHALGDDQVSEALVAGSAALAVVQWTGASRQRLTVPWTQVTSFEALDAFRAEVAADVRVWRNFSTAIGEALHVSAGLFADAPACARRVIDISGDGVSNEGVTPANTHAIMQARGITVNALVIEDATAGDLTGYFYENVITGPGAFLVTAGGYRDYPRQIRRKLLREVVQTVGAVTR